MQKRITALLTCLAFILFEAMCTHVVKRPVATVAGPKNQRVIILKVLKKNGEVVTFSEKRPGQVLGQSVVGPSSAGERLVFKPGEIKSTKLSEKRAGERQSLIEITTTSGQTYGLSDPAVQSIEAKKGAYIVTTRKVGTIIPLSDIDLVWAKRPDPAMTVLAVLGGIALAGAAVVALIAALKESCPFIYSYDGQRFIFDAEPYGGATSRGVQRTEWCTLEHIREVNGRYTLKITNEVDETQNTDELKLVVVDHPRGVQAVPDESGGIHTVVHPVLPLSARDGRGRDLLPLLQGDDWIFWQSRIDDKDPENPADTRDELTLEFPKPAGADKAKLVFNGCNTLWASQMVKLFLELHGRDIARCYAAVDAHGLAYEALQSWNLREELYRLNLRVETANGWVSKGTVVGGGPFVSEDRVYPLDLSDVPGDTVKIRLLPPTGFWMINYLALDYAGDLPVRTTEVAPFEARDSTGRDVRAELSASDHVYYSMPRTGDWGTVTFLAPPHQPGLDRTVICKAAGFYDIHLKADGPARLDVLMRMQTEPGFAARYALREYIRWVKENSQASPDER